MLNMTKVIIFTLINIYSSCGNFETIFCFFPNNIDKHIATMKNFIKFRVFQQNFFTRESLDLQNLPSLAHFLRNLFSNRNRRRKETKDSSYYTF